MVGDTGAVILNQTPFYGESGGQVGDTGTIERRRSSLRVTDTQKKAGGLFVHYGVLKSGTLQVGTALTLVVDHDRRSAIRKIIRLRICCTRRYAEILGDHVAQREASRPRSAALDFSYPKAISANEIDLVENLANGIVEQNTQVDTDLMAVKTTLSSPGLARCSARNTDRSK